MEQYIAQLRDSQGWISTPNIHPHWRLPLLRHWFGQSVVVVAMKPGTKEMCYGGSLNQYPALMLDAGYLTLLSSNIVDLAILNGPEGDNICAVDLDTPEASTDWQCHCENFINAMSDLVVGSSKRGLKYFFRLVGDYPKKKAPLGGSSALGDFMSGGGVTKVFGMHPEGVPYRIWVRNKVPQVSFNDIPFPPSFQFPPPTEKLSCFYESGRGVQLDEWQIAREIAKMHPVCYEAVSDSFYGWKDRGLFEPLHLQDVHRWISAFIELLARETGCKALLTKRGRHELASIATALKGEVSRAILEESKRNSKSYFPAANGDVGLESHSLSIPHPDRAMIARSPVVFDPHAQCPRFLNWMNQMFPAQGDLRVVQLVFAQVLMGRNLGKKILVVHGRGDTGKSTLLRVLRTVIGFERFAELRTSHLDGRFEMAAFRGKSALVANDVCSSFLMTHGAHKLKALTGGDANTVELKNAIAHGTVMGDFNVIICSNALLRVATQLDASAFLSRLVIVTAQPFVGEPVPDFDRDLIEQEGAGILNWLLEGQRALRAARHPSQLFGVQPHRDNVILKSLDIGGQIQEFARRCLESATQADNMSISEIHDLFSRWCESTGIAQDGELSVDSFGRYLTPVVGQLFEDSGVSRASVQRGAARLRGYRGLRSKVPS